MSTVTSITKARPDTGGKTAVFEGFPLALRAGDVLYLGSQHALAGAQADIAEQTHGVFRNMVQALASHGLSMADLMKLHTYYVYEGEGADVTGYWERMTAVRLQYLADPGPAATALRVSGCPSGHDLITIDGIAALGGNRQRIMPAHAWDWSIPTPLSQGWKVGNKVYVGGQISADRQGKAIAAWDVVEQTRNTLEYIRHVLLDAGGSWSDVVSLKVAFRHDGHDAESRRLLDTILGIVRASLPVPGPALTCIGVDLLYEGLVLEIDAVAVIGQARESFAVSGEQTWVSIPGFPAATRVGGEVYVSGLSAPGAASLAAQAEATMQRLGLALEAAATSLDHLVKMNVFYVGGATSQAHDVAELVRIVGEYLPNRRPVLSITRLPGLPHDGQRVQIDALAVTPAADEFQLSGEN